MSSVKGLGKFRARPKRPEGEKIVQVSFRAPESLKKYVGDAAESQGMNQEDFITEALEMDRDLAKELDGQDDRLRAFALAMGVYLEEKMPEVLAALIKKGLDCQDVECAKKSKK